jgi:hypothetical protein
MKTALPALSLRYTRGVWAKWTSFRTDQDRGPSKVSWLKPGSESASGQLPNPLIERLADAFNASAQREPDEQKRGRLREIAVMLTGILKGLAVAIAGEVIARKGIG